MVASCFNFKRAGSVARGSRCRWKSAKYGILSSRTTRFGVRRSSRCMLEGGRGPMFRAGGGSGLGVFHAWRRFGVGGVSCLAAVRGWRACLERSLFCVWSCKSLNKTPAGSVLSFLFRIFNFVLDTPSRHNRANACFCARLFVSLASLKILTLGKMQTSLLLPSLIRIFVDRKNQKHTIQ